MKYPATKIGNVIFYKVYKDTWLTHDNKYGIFRAHVKRNRECVIAKNNDPASEIYFMYPNFDLIRMDDFPIYKNAKEAMKAVCENLYNEEV